MPFPLSGQVARNRLIWPFFFFFFCWNQDNERLREERVRDFLCFFFFFFFPFYAIKKKILVFAGFKPQKKKKTTISIHQLTPHTRSSSKVIADPCDARLCAAPVSLPAPPPLPLHAPLPPPSESSHCPKGGTSWPMSHHPPPPLPRPPLIPCSYGLIHPFFLCPESIVETLHGKSLLSGPGLRL